MNLTACDDVEDAKKGRLDWQGWLCYGQVGNNGGKYAGNPRVPGKTCIGKLGTLRYTRSHRFWFAALHDN